MADHVVRNASTKCHCECAVCRNRPRATEYLPAGSCPPYFSQLTCGTGNPSATHSSARSLPSVAVIRCVDLSWTIRGSALSPAPSNSPQCQRSDIVMLSVISFLASSYISVDAVVDRYVSSGISGAQRCESEFLRIV